jgi:hypothetical protein
MVEKNLSITVSVKIKRADYLRAKKFAEAKGITIEEAIHELISPDALVVTPLKHHWTAEEILRREG